MNDQRPNETGPESRIEFRDDLACDVCGRFGAVELGGRKLCLDCYEGCGSCCPEFGKEE